MPKKSIFQLEVTLLLTSHQVMITAFVILPSICVHAAHGGRECARERENWQEIENNQMS